MKHDEKKIKELMFLLDSRKIDIDTFNWITEVAMKQYAEHMVKQERKVIADVVFSEAKNTGQLVHINTVRVLDIINN